MPRNAISGMQMLEALQNGAAPQPPVLELTDISLTEFGAGWAVLEMEVRRKHHNSMGYAHGGMLATLGDAVLGTALVTTLEPGELFTTLDLHTNYLSQARNGLLRAHGKVLRRGRTTAYCEADITDQLGRLIARASCTCMITKGHWNGGETV